MKRNPAFAALAASLFVAATVAYADESDVSQVASAEGTIMEDVQPSNASASVEQPLAEVSPFPTQGPDDK